jgi:hypothetical protein
VKDNVTGGTNTGNLPDCVRIQEGYVRAYSDFYVDDNVGIGTVSPTGKAHIYVDNASSGQLFIENASTSGRAGLILRNADGEDFNIQHTNGSSNAAIIENFSTVNGGIQFYAKGDGDYQFRTTNSNTLRMVIRNDGNVGIGTAAPESKLTIKGVNGRIDQTSLTQLRNSSTITLQAYNATADVVCMGLLTTDQINFSGDNPNFYIQNMWDNQASGGRPILLNPADGNVGIGTTSPGATLEVSGTVESPILKRNSTASTGTFNYILNGPRPGTTSGGAVHFINGSTRSADGGPSTYTIRNDNGALNLGNQSYGSRIIGSSFSYSNGDGSVTTYGPNSTWNSYLFVGAASDRNTGDNSDRAQVICTNGNLHLDAGGGRDIFLNFYSGNFVRYGSGATVIHSSDDRLKTQEELIQNATDTLMKLQPQKYLKSTRLPGNGDLRPPFVEAGLIAQDIWYDAPELRFLVSLADDATPSETKPGDTGDIQQDPDYSDWGTESAGVSYISLIPYLIKSNQEIYTELQAEKAKVASVLARLDALENA